MYFVYVLRSLKDGSTYIGFTSDLERRLIEHNEGRTKSIKHKIPYELYYYEAYSDKSTARRREIKLKKSGYEKEKLFERIFNSENKEIN
ncbi:MAG: GIY-YIG nuclease family protein [Bacteroidetes bacterium]|nr:GIY-YIG nuclease family protein [Bacteroidota bacterium]